jgi:hypothetical protein
MKMLTKPAIFILAVFILIIAAACKKDSDKAAIHIDGFKLKDYNANDIGYYGPVDNDWTFKNTLSDREMALFDFLPADVNLNNTVEAAIWGNSIIAYPNPFAYSQYYGATASDSVLMKVVVVNDKLNVLTRKTFKGKGYIPFAIDYNSDTLLYPNKSSLRMYYSFSAQNKPNYKVGYGDLKICRVDIPTNNINSCFP